MNSSLRTEWIFEWIFLLKKEWVWRTLTRRTTRTWTRDVVYFTLLRFSNCVYALLIYYLLIVRSSGNNMWVSNLCYFLNFTSRDISLLILHWKSGMRAERFLTHIERRFALQIIEQMLSLKLEDWILCVPYVAGINLFEIMETFRFRMDFVGIFSKFSLNSFTPVFLSGRVFTRGIFIDSE